MISNYVLVPIVTAGGVYVVAQWLRPKPYPGIPSNPVTSVLGDLPTMASETMKYGSVFEAGCFFPRSIQELGPVFQIEQFFMGPISKSIVVADLQEMEDILLRTRSKGLDNSDIQATAFQITVPYGSVALKTDDMWKQHRRVTAPLTATNHLIQMAPAIATNAKALMSYWTRKMDIVQQHGAVCFSCQNDFEMSTLDVIGELIAGRSLGMVAHASTQNPTVKVDQYGGAISEVSPTPLFASLRYLFGCITDTTMLPPWLARTIQTAKSWRSRYIRSRRIVDEYISTCLEASRKNVKELREIGQEVEAAKCMIDMGYDTTSGTLQWAVKLLTDHPDVQRKLNAELRGALEDLSEDRILTYADVNSPEKMPYLEATIAEILRRGPIAEATRRQTTEPMKVLGHDIPVGSNLIFLGPTAAAMTTKSKEPSLRNYDDLRSETSLKYGLQGKRLWDDDTPEFKPERWLVVDEKTGKQAFDPKAGGSVPFGLGQRSCPGKPLAMLELKMFIATLNLAFFLGPVPKELSKYDPVIQLTRFPAQAYIAPRPWTAEDR
ncbi:hypothetical protein FRB90_004904 [Tulasnella sp. 427]|nr:hypothetical protein FRB90_004904 [Tulasnella sp. 427]